MAAYLHYEQLYRQVFDRSSSNYTGFNRFAHERNLAGPDYATFKVPNTDTLYSTAWRSEEHTSELQSLMRISYAVFCLKQKTYIKSHTSLSTLTKNTLKSNQQCTS